MTHKTIVPAAAWEKAGLRGHPDLPAPAVIDSQVCYIGDIALARKVLSLLKEHAGDPEIDRAIWVVERSIAFRGESKDG